MNRTAIRLCVAAGLVIALGFFAYRTLASDRNALPAQKDAVETSREGRDAQAVDGGRLDPIRSDAFREKAPLEKDEPSLERVDTRTRITGIVKGPTREGLEGATVRLYRRYRGQLREDRERFQEARTTAGGRFGFDLGGLRPGGTYLVGAWATGLRPSDRLPIEPNDPSFVIQLSERGARLRGRVVDSAGKGVGGAKVMLGGKHGWERIDGRGRGAGAAPMRTVADAAGEFEFNDAPAGVTRVEARASGFGPLTQRVELSLDAPAQVVLSLAEGVQLSGVVMGPGGPAKGADIVAYGYARYEESRTRTDENGAFQIAELAAEKVQLEARADGCLVERATFYPLEGEVLTWSPLLRSSPVIQGKVVNVALEPLPGWNIIGKPAQGSRRSAVSAADGTFILDQLSDLPYRVFVSKPGYSLPLECTWLGTMRPPITNLQITMPNNSYAATVTGVVEGTSGLVEGAYALLRVPGLWTGTAITTNRQGEFSIPKVAKGTYDLEVRHPSGEPRVLRRGLEVPAQGVVSVGLLKLPRTGSLEIAVASVGNSDLLKDVMVSAESTQPETSPAFVQLKQGKGQVALKAGTYEINIYGGGFAWLRREVKVHAGKTVVIKEQLRAGVQRQLVLPYPEPSWWSKVESFRVTVARDDGAVQISSDFNHSDLWPFTWWPTLLPGSYRVSVKAQGHPRLSGSFELESLTPSLQPIRIPMTEGR